MPLFQMLCLGIFRCHVYFDCLSIGVVIGQGSIHLRQRQMWNLGGDLFRRQARVVPADEALYGLAWSGDTRTAAAFRVRACAQ
jgi:hypothetical protein